MHLLRGYRTLIFNFLLVSIGIVQKLELPIKRAHCEYSMQHFLHRIMGLNWSIQLWPAPPMVWLIEARGPTRDIRLPAVL